MRYTEKDYQEAIEFAFNYPPEIMKWKYIDDDDNYDVILLDGGIYNIKLQGFFVRSCLKWKGKKQWVN